MSMFKYPKIYAVGHREVLGITNGPVEVEEKVDGSQITFYVEDGRLVVESRNNIIDIDSPPKLFAAAVATLNDLHKRDLILSGGIVYRGEAVCSPRHNVITYSRIPNGGVVLYDVAIGLENYLSHDLVEKEAEAMGLECVPLLLSGNVSMLDLEKLMDRESFLGGSKIEGVVIKDKSRFRADGKPFYAKLVSADFKERAKKSAPKNAPIAESVGSELRTEARFHKALQRLVESGEATGTPADIGKLMREVHADVSAEDADYIKGRLYDHHIKDIKRVATHGLAEWYKALLYSREGEVREAV